MKMLVQVLKEGSFTSDTSFSQQIEGTPQYCTGYMKAVRDMNLGKTVIGEEL